MRPSKKISLLLLGAMLSLNLLPELSQPCQAKMKKEMSCCMSEHTQDNSTIQKISPLRCGCFLSKGTPSQNPAHASPLISQQSFEITVKKSDTIALHSKGVFGRDNLVAWKSDLFYHQKVSSHTKIYSLIESYLI